LLLLNQHSINTLITPSANQPASTSVEAAPNLNPTSTLYGGLLDLRKMLEMNQLLLEFDTALQKTTDDIREFWQSVSTQRDTSALFGRGIKISEELQRVQKLVISIER
jgi:hypothetical protein